VGPTDLEGPVRHRHTQPGLSITSLRHDAFVYESDDEFVGHMVPFVAGGLQEGEAVVAVTTVRNAALLREALGGDAERVSFVDRDKWYVRPAQAIASYDKTLRQHLDAGAPVVRVIGELPFGTTPLEWDEWTAYEAIANRAFADRPAWIVCPYDARVLPDSVVKHAAHTHPNVLTDLLRASAHYEPPEDLVRALTRELEPLAGLRSIPLAEDARRFRVQLASELQDAGVPEPRASAMLVAASEVFINAVRYGYGPRTVLVGRVDDGFVCEIADHGPGLDDPLIGYMPPAPEQASGNGLWIARQLTSRLEMRSSADGLTARLWV
jgi:anti-sigma regulatory factor (Ser/Thr protein kinase)